MSEVDRSIDVGEFEVGRNLHEILSALVQSLDERLAGFLDSDSEDARERIREEYPRLTDLYLWDLLRQIDQLDEARDLLRESFELWLDLSCEEILSGALAEKRDRKTRDSSWTPSKFIQ